MALGEVDTDEGGPGEPEQTIQDKRARLIELGQSVPAGATDEELDQLILAAEADKDGDGDGDGPSEPVDLSKVRTHAALDKVAKDEGVTFDPDLSVEEKRTALETARAAGENT
jgi:hypothetical protein